VVVSHGRRPVYTLVQVAVNDLIMLFAFAPIIMLLCGVAHVVVPAKVLITSVVVFIVIPLAAGWLTRTILLKARGQDWFEENFLPKFHPVTIAALLLTLVLIFAFQAENLTARWFAVLLLAVPIIIQVYFNATLAYLLMRRWRVPHNIASPERSLERATSLSWPWPWPSPCLGQAPARRWQPWWGAGGSAGDAFGLRGLQPDAALVCRGGRSRREPGCAKDRRRNHLMKTKVLFVCVHNSARSQMAEAFLNRICPEEFEAHSAGLQPGKLNPVVVEAMREVGIDISGNQTKAVFDLFKSGQLFSHVITVCDETSAERCPIFPGVTTRLHWSFADPASFRAHPRRFSTRRAKCAMPSRKRSKSGAAKCAANRETQADPGAGPIHLSAGEAVAEGKAKAPQS